MDIKVYNTLDHKLEKFKPIKKGEVQMYTCGPTVYWYQHIGNMRAYIFADILKRVLIYNGYKVKQVINITDVGHLTSDADTGEDKLEKGARREGKTAYEVARYYEEIFKKDIKKLNILEPFVWSRATEHISEQIELVKILERKGFTYRTSDGIYFDTSKLADYGKLAKLDIKGLQAGKRIEIGEKKHKTDFALWKFEPKSDKRQMVWKSPWGERTFPGWHIECSAMGMKYLGDHFDIHTGGIDHISVHHTNEIAQNEAATGHKVVNYWMHLEHLMFDKGKMSKSEGGIITVDTLIDKGYDPLAFRYLMLTALYRNRLNFSWDSLDAAQNAYYKLKKYMTDVEDKKTGKILTKYKDDFMKAINNDLDTPSAIALVWHMVKSQEKPSDIYATLLDFDKVLGLDLRKAHEDKISNEIIDRLKQMDKAREDKDYNFADKIRTQIENEGYKVLNTPNGSKVERI